MEALNHPVEMIATCSPEGAMCPARFRLETDGGERLTVRIRNVQSSEEIFYTGIEALRFECSAVIGHRLRTFELRYTVRTHRWVLWRFLDNAPVRGGSARS